MLRGLKYYCLCVRRTFQHGPGNTLCIHWRHMRHMPGGAERQEVIATPIPIVMTHSAIEAQSKSRSFHCQGAIKIKIEPRSSVEMMACNFNTKRDFPTLLGSPKKTLEGSSMTRISAHKGFLQQTLKQLFKNC